MEESTLRNSLKKSSRRMQRKAQDAQRPRHIKLIGDRASTLQRSDAPPQVLLQNFPCATR